MENVFCLDLGTIDYAECWELQKNFFGRLLATKGQTVKGRNAAGQHNEAAQRNGDGLPEQYILLCEHPAVYTLGKSGDEGNMLAGEEFLKSKGASFYRIDRGGDVTFHGPGQLVGYPILDLEREGLSLRGYVHSLEQAVIDTVAEFGITGTRLAGAAGVWLVDERPLRKICAIGIRSSRYVTMHGFALNANTDLSWFGHINPCGFADRGVTSIEKETGEKVDMDLLKNLFLTHFQKVVNIKINIKDYANRKTLGNKAPG